jgi:hypothetical protein
MTSRNGRCGSAARIRNAATSLEYCSRVCGASSSKLTWPDCNGGALLRHVDAGSGGTSDYPKVQVLLSIGEGNANTGTISATRKCWQR